MKATELFEDEKFAGKADEFVLKNPVCNDELCKLLNCVRGKGVSWAFVEKKAFERIDGGVIKAYDILEIAQLVKNQKRLTSIPVIKKVAKGKNEDADFGNVNWLAVYVQHKKKLPLEDLGYGKIRFLTYFKQAIESKLSSTEIEIEENRNK